MEKGNRKGKVSVERGKSICRKRKKQTQKEEKVDVERGESRCRKRDAKRSKSLESYKDLFPETEYLRRKDRVGGN